MYMNVNSDDKEKDEKEKENPIMVVKDRDPPGTGMTFAHVLPDKSTSKFNIDTLERCILPLGHKRVILKSDQEPSILSLKDAVKARGNIEVILEESPKYESQSNGVIENAIKFVQDQIRTTKDALEGRIIGKIENNNNIIPWLVIHAAETINRYHIPKNKGYTAYERLKGRKFVREVTEFGECVLFRMPTRKGQE